MRVEDDANSSNALPPQSDISELRHCISVAVDDLTEEMSSDVDSVISAIDSIDLPLSCSSCHAHRDVDADVYISDDDDDLDDDIYRQARQEFKRDMPQFN
jgi:hypothetical protein